MPHESAALHVTGHALYTDDLVGRTQHVPARAPGPGAARARPRHPARRRRAAYAVPGVVRVLTADDVPGVNDAGIKHDEPLFPSEVMYIGHSVCWVLGETLEAARRGAPAVEVDYEPLPSLLTVEEAIAAESFQGARPTVVRGDTDAGLAPGDARLRGRHVDRRAGALLPRDALLARAGRRERPGLRAVQHPAPDRDPGDRRARARPRPATRVTVQCLRMGGGFGGKEMQPHGLAAVAALGSTLTGRPVRLRLTRQQDMTMTGKRHGFHATWKVGLRRRRPVHRAGGDADLRRRLEPRPLRAGAVAGAVPHRQRLLDPRHRSCTAGSRRPTRPRRRRSAASAGRRGCS